MDIFKENLTPRERDSLFYYFLAGGARTKLLESVIDMHLPELLAERGPLTVEEIADTLALQPLRAKKWLYLLTTQGLLRRSGSGDETRYELGPATKEIFGADGTEGWFFKQMTASWQGVAVQDLNAVLRGAPVPVDVQWPPQTMEAVEEVEAWMTLTSEGPLHAIEKAIDLDKVDHLFDVGGGVGTMACVLASKHEDLKVTVFNVPKAAYLARANIANAGLAERVTVAEGDFLEDEAFPQQGFDLVLFSRVLTDWSPEVSRKLLKMAYDALAPGGRVAICEALMEGNEDFALAWEYRYIYWDSFGTEVYKPRAVYEEILTDIGFQLDAFSEMDDESFYSVLTAKK